MEVNNWKGACLSDLLKWKREDLQLFRDTGVERFRALADEKESAIRAKLAEVDGECPFCMRLYGHGHPRAKVGHHHPECSMLHDEEIGPLVPDAERVYLTQAARSLPWPVDRWAAEKEERRKLVEGSEYLRRHPEMIESLTPEEQAKDDEWERYIAAGL